MSVTVGRQRSDGRSNRYHLSKTARNRFLYRYPEDLALFAEMALKFWIVDCVDPFVPNQEETTPNQKGSLFTAMSFKKCSAWDQTDQNVVSL